MLDHVRGRWMGIDSWAGQPLYSLAPVIEEGMPLCEVMENGKASATVLASPGGSDRFLGIAYNWLATPTVVPVVENYTVPAGGGAITIANAPLNGAGGITVRNNSTGAVYTQGTAATGVYNLGGTNNQTLTFAAGDAGANVSVLYAYTPSTVQALAMAGDGWIGHSTPADVTGTIGLIRRGIVYTSNFNPGVDWSAVNTTLKVGANGIITNTGSGPTIPGYVYEQPSADSPFLGIYFTAP